MPACASLKKKNNKPFRILHKKKILGLPQMHSSVVYKHKLGQLHGCAASRKQQSTELWFKQSKLKFLLFHCNAAKSVYLHYLQDISVGMERKKLLVSLVKL